MLEQRLERINREETIPLRLGSSRSDNNVERNSVLSEIDNALAEYGPYMLYLGEIQLSLIRQMH